MVQAEGFEPPTSSKIIQIYSLAHPTVCALLAWRRAAESNGLPEGASAFKADRITINSALQKVPGSLETRGPHDLLCGDEMADG
jgi:hypothetical protein